MSESPSAAPKANQNPQNAGAAQYPVYMNQPQPGAQMGANAYQGMYMAGAGATDPYTGLPIAGGYPMGAAAPGYPLAGAGAGAGLGMGAGYGQMQAGAGAGGFSQGQQVSMPNASFPENPAEGVNLFVFHLPSAVDDTTLYRLFAPFGALGSVKVITNRATGESKGYGFVKFLNMADAVQAINALNGYKLGNKYLKVAFKSSK